MHTSTGLSVASTVVFLVTGTYSLLRLLWPPSGAARPDRLAASLDLLMSAAMIAMMWAWTGGPTSTSGMLQIALFGALTLWFLGRVVNREPGHVLTNAWHVLAAATMTWMAVAMPPMTGMDMSGMDMPGMDMSGMDVSEPGQAVVSTPGLDAVGYALLVLLTGATLWWVWRAASGVAPTDADPAPAGGTAALAARRRLGRLGDARVEAGCHVLMSVGMAAAVLTML